MHVRVGFPVEIAIDRFLSTKTPVFRNGSLKKQTSEAQEVASAREQPPPKFGGRFLAAQKIREAPIVGIDDLI